MPRPVTETGGAVWKQNADPGVEIREFNKERRALGRMTARNYFGQFFHAPSERRLEIALALDAL